MTKKNTAATIATIIVAVLAVATTCILLYHMSQNEFEETGSKVFIPTEEVNNEMKDNAQTLVQNNCEVFRVFMQYGLAHESEPYNNLPEDGLYTVKSDKYKTMEQLEKLVRDTFVEKEADRILEDVNGGGAVYAEQEDGSLGLVMKAVDKDGRFIGYDYGYSWTTANLTLKPVSDTECQLTIVLQPEENEDTSAAGEAKSFEVTMLKANGVWLLEKLAY